MLERITELLTAIDDVADPAVRLRVTADQDEVSQALARHPRIDVVGRLDHHALRELWARSQAIYFPTEIESFGYPLAKRVHGQPVIALDTEQNREVAGPALRGFTAGDPDTLRCAIERALTAEVAPDPVPFDPGAYFSWLLGPLP